jgi:hypothetical protein
VKRPRLPAVRTIKGQRRVVTLILVCDECGNREVGWAWTDPQRLVRFDGMAEPPADVGDGNLPELAAMDWAELKRRRGRLAGPRTERLIKAYVTDDRRLFAYCPRHGEVATREVVGPHTDVAGRTRWLRAYPCREV